MAGRKPIIPENVATRKELINLLNEKMKFASDCIKENIIEQDGKISVTEELLNAAERLSYRDRNHNDQKEENGRSIPNVEYENPVFNAYYFYRYYVRLGFLDGREGKIFCFMQAYWYRTLVDAKIYEYNQNNNSK